MTGKSGDATRRMLGGPGVVAVVAASLLAAPVSWADEDARGPAFDCASVGSTVEKLICGDEGLASLDRKLDEVYGAAMAKADGSARNTLRVEQRGWIKGRDECWKATGERNPVFLTESWKATSISECVRAQYRLRISELQIRWQLAPAKAPAFFMCENNPANEVVATFFATDPPAARLERGDRTVIAWQVASGSGERYEGQNVTFLSKGGEARVTWLDVELKCIAR